MVDNSKGTQWKVFLTFPNSQLPFPSCVFPDPRLCRMGVGRYHQDSVHPPRCFTCTYVCTCVSIFIYTHTRHRHTHTHITLWNVFVRCLLFFLLTVYLGDHCISVVKAIFILFPWLHSIILQEFITTSFWGIHSPNIKLSCQNSLPVHLCS